VWGLRDDLLRRRMWLLPLRDACWFFTWVASYFFTRIRWRGSEYRVVAGKLVPVAGASDAVRAETAAR